MINCVNMYERFCDDVSVDNKKHTNNIQTMLLLFQKNVDVREAYRQIFSNYPFLDWAQSEQIKSLKIYKDTSAWITLLQFVEFVTDEINWKLYVQKHKIFLARLRLVRVEWYLEWTHKPILGLLY